MYKKLLSKIDKRLITGLVLLLLTIISVEIYATQLIPDVRKVFFNVLERRAADELSYGLMLFASVLVVLILTQGFKSYVARLTALEVRKSLSKVLLKSWVQSGKIKGATNPDQRIAEDCNLATDAAIKVALEFVISAALVVVLLIGSKNNPHILYSSLIYTVIVVLGAGLFRRRLVDVNNHVKVREANYRTSLVKIHMDNGDFTAKENFRELVLSIKSYLKTSFFFTLFSVSQNQFSIFVPWLILTPKLFAGEIDFGTFMQDVAIFELIVINSTIAVQMYPEITKAEAAWIRITEFYNNVKDE